MSINHEMRLRALEQKASEKQDAPDLKELWAAVKDLQNKYRMLNARVSRKDDGK